MVVIQASLLKEGSVRRLYPRLNWHALSRPLSGITVKLQSVRFALVADVYSTTIERLMHTYIPSHGDIEASLLLTQSRRTDSRPANTRFLLPSPIGNEPISPERTENPCDR